MERLRRVVSNTVVSLIGQLMTWTSTLLLTIAYGRFLGDVQFGELYFALTFVLLIGFPIESGFNQQLTRDVAQEPQKALRYLSNTLLIKVALWLVFYGAILLLVRLLGYPDEMRSLVTLCGITLLSTSIATTFAASHYAFERPVFPVIGTIFEKGSTALLGIFLLKLGAGVQVMALVLLGGSLLNTTWQALWFFRLVGFSFRIDVALLRMLIRVSIPFIAYGVLGVIYYRVDTVLLSLLENAAVVGWYGAGYRIFDTLVFLPNIVISAIMYPIFAKLSLHSTAELRTAIEKSMNFLLFASIPMMTFIMTATPLIVGFLYHRPEFLNTIPAMQALAPGLVFLYMNSVLSATLVSIKQEKKITLMAGIALIFNLGLNLILIPRYLHVGAALVTSLTELLLLCLSLIFVPRNLLPVGSLRIGIKVLVASALMAAATWLAIWELHIGNIFVVLSLAILVYLGAAMLLGSIPREDLQALSFAVRHRAQRVPPVPPDDQAEESNAPLEARR